MSPRRASRRAQRRVVPVLVLAMLATVPAILLAGVWQFAETNVAPPTTTTTTTLPPPPTAALVTPLLSLRRQPEAVARQIAQAQSQVLLEARLAELTAGIGPESCLRVVAGDTVIVDVRPDRAVTPASNQKLLVAAVALDVLGPGHRFRTRVDSPPPTDGVVAGDLYLIGGGDPLLRTDGVVDPLRYPAFNTTSLDVLADQVASLGVTTIDGDVVGDAGRYDDEFRVPGWGGDITSVDAGPYDALLVNDGLISATDYGLDPSRSAARAFLDLLLERGITVTGSAASGDRPADAALTTLALIESEPLTDVLVEMLHTSDNNTAEMLVKELGYAATGAGTRDAGLATIAATLADWGVPMDGVSLHDGSGLSRDDRVTCATITAVLTATPVAAALRDLLPVAGRDGTLVHQFKGSYAEGRLQAKTGTLTGVKALAGTLGSQGGVRIEFALILNGADVDDPSIHVPVWRRLVDVLRDYPIEVLPDVEAVSPR
ncbi:MAG TPA: D-alanyl-D-alanine carboxypeptidase/D-alanyl-D-alanine-endopeptidase [Ilumatobacter sp.]